MRSLLEWREPADTLVDEQDLDDRTTEIPAQPWEMPPPPVRDSLPSAVFELFARACPEAKSTP